MLFKIILATQLIYYIINWIISSIWKELLVNISDVDDTFVIIHIEFLSINWKNNLNELWSSI